MRPGPRTSAAEQVQALLQALDALLAPMARAAAGPCPPTPAVLRDILAQHQAMAPQRALLWRGPWLPLGPLVGKALQNVQQAASLALGGQACPQHVHVRLLASIARFRVLLAHWPWQPGSPHSAPPAGDAKKP